MVLTVDFWAHSSPGGSGFPVALSLAATSFIGMGLLRVAAWACPFSSPSQGSCLVSLRQVQPRARRCKPLTQFYFRRIRRIMPALLFFTFFDLLSSTSGTKPLRGPRILGDIATSLLFWPPVLPVAGQRLARSRARHLVADAGDVVLPPLPLLAVITRATSRKLLWLLIPAMLALGTLYQRHVVSDPRFVAHENHAAIQTFAWGMAAASLSVACPRIVNGRSSPIWAAFIVFATVWDSSSAAGH